MSDRTVSIYTSLEEVPSDFDGFARIKNDNYRATIEGNGTSRIIRGWGPSSYRPAATLFSIGTWQDQLEVSEINGISWVNVSM